MDRTKTLARLRDLTRTLLMPQRVSGHVIDNARRCSRTRRVWGPGIRALGCLVALCGLTACGPGTPRVRVGSKNFTEQVVLGEIIVQHLQHRLRIPVDRRLNLGGTLLAHQGLKSGQIDLYPEYTGTALTAVLKKPVDRDQASVLRTVRAAYRHEFQIEWLDPLGIDDSFAMVIRGEDARRLHLSTLSEAAAVTEPWALGVGYEFQRRIDGLPALEQAYHLRWSDRPKNMDLGLLYQALGRGQVTMIAANATDGLLSKMDVKALADDRRAFPPYQICILVRQQSFAKDPELRAALEELSGKLTNQQMQHLNYQVDGEHRPVAEVASAFLRQAGLK